MKQLNSVGGQLDKGADPRGVLGMFYAHFFKGQYGPVDTKLDAQAFFDQILMFETIFRAMGLSTSDFSTSPRQPTSGIFHLSRLGQLGIDEQFFQNIMSGLTEAVPQFKTIYDKMTCGEIESLALQVARYLQIPSANQTGILYR